MNKYRTDMKFLYFISLIIRKIKSIKIQRLLKKSDLLKLALLISPFLSFFSTDKNSNVNLLMILSLYLSLNLNLLNHFHDLLFFKNFTQLTLLI